MAGDRNKTAKGLSRAEKKIRALQMRAEDFNYTEIAAELGVGVTTAWRYIEEALKERKKKQAEKAEKLLVLELERLRKLCRPLWGKATDPENPDLRASEQLGKHIDRRIRLLALEPPKQVRQKIDVNGMSTEQLLRLAPGAIETLAKEGVEDEAADREARESETFN